MCALGRLAALLPAQQIIPWKPVNGTITISGMMQIAVSPDMPELLPARRVIHG